MPMNLKKIKTEFKRFERQASGQISRLMKISDRFLPSVPIGPPIPRRQLIEILRRLRKVLNQRITALERKLAVKTVQGKRAK